MTGIVECFVLAYFVSLIVAYSVVRSAITDRAFRLVFFVTAVAFPAIVVWGVISTLLGGAKSGSRDLDFGAYHPAFGATEGAIEAERVRLFGGDLAKSAISEHWLKAYQSHMEKQSEVKAFALRTAHWSQQIRALKLHINTGRA